jgi:UDP-glucose 4-epimerase
VGDFSFNDASVCVVGGAGFVGSNLCHKLLQQPIKELFIVDNLLSADSSRIAVDSRVKFLYGSIAEDTILSQLPTHLNYVFHLATYHGNQSSIHDPIADHENNTLTSLKLFNHIRSFSQLKKVVYSSAGCTVAQKTFSDAKETTENDSVSLYLDSPYQMSKIFGEFYGNYFFYQYKMPFVKARFQNVYGPGEILGAGRWRGTSHTVWRNVIPTFIFKALHEQKLPLENNGIATRDFIYVDDIVDGLIQCATQGIPGEIYNLASGNETSILDLAQLINRATHNTADIDAQPPRSWDRSGKRFGSTLKAKTELGFEAKVSIEEGIKKTVQWTQNNLETIQRCMLTHAGFVPEIVNFFK